MTPVKLQNPWGTCWGFAAIAASETSILSKLKAAGMDYGASSPYYDLSERQLAWFAYSPIPEGDDSGQGGEGMINLTDNENTPFNNGGLAVLATSIFSSGIGPLTEEKAPYRNDEGDLQYVEQNGETVLDENGNPIPLWYAMEGTWKLDESMRYQQVIDLEETYVLPVPATFETDDEGNMTYVYNADATTAIKEQLMEGRAVSIAFCADQSMPGQITEQQYINPDTWAHYTYEPASANHAVTIVGWDDSYSASNFTERHQPEGNGAWIVKNSWGSSDAEFPNHLDWGIEGSGHFYLSYYDQSISIAEAFDYNTAGVSTRDSYYANQYDYMPSSAAFTETDDTKMSTANIFTAEADQVVATLTCETTSPNSIVTYELYRLDDDSTSPTDGTKVDEITETYEYGGFHRIELSESQQLVLPQGAKDSVVVTQRVADEYVFSVDAGSSVKAVEEYNEAMRQLFALLILDSVREEYPDATEEELMEIALEYIDVIIEEGILTLTNVAANGVVNPGESFAYMDGKWIDESELVKTYDEDGEGLYVFDNFPIKAYSEELDAPFSDVAADKWYYQAVEYAKDNGIMNGYGDGTFGPEHVITREQAACALHNIMGDGTKVESQGMTDVADGQWYTDAVNWAVKNGVMDGYGNKVFGVGDTLTREQFACVIAKAVDEAADDDSAIKDMPDADKVSDWAVEGVAWAVENGVINGVETEDGHELQPQAAVTRAQMAAMMMNAIKGNILYL